MTPRQAFLDIVELPAAIADSATESAEVDLKNLTPVGIWIPSDFNGTTLAFKNRLESAVTPLSVIDGATGTAISKTVAANTYLPLDPSVFAGMRFLTLVAGSQSGISTPIVVARSV